MWGESHLLKGEQEILLDNGGRGEENVLIPPSSWRILGLFDYFYPQMGKDVNDQKIP